MDYDISPEFARAIAFIIFTLTEYYKFFIISIAKCYNKFNIGNAWIELPISIILKEKYYKLWSSSDKFIVASSENESLSDNLVNL